MALLEPCIAQPASTAPATSPRPRLACDAFVTFAVPVACQRATAGHHA